MAANTAATPMGFRDVLPRVAVIGFIGRSAPALINK